MTNAASIASSIDASAVLTQAKNVNRQSGQTYQKETNVERKDMEKAKSIFTKAAEIANKGNEKLKSVAEKIDAKIVAKQKEADEPINKIIESATDEILASLKEEVDAKLAKKEELENEHPELKDMNSFKTEKGSPKVKNKTITVPLKDKDGNIVPTQVSLVESEGQEAGTTGNTTFLDEYIQVCNELGVSCETYTQALNIRQSMTAQLVSISEDLSSITQNGQQELSNLNQQINTNLNNQITQLEPVKISQNNSMTTTSQTSKVADQMSGTASSAANSTDDESLKEQLESVSRDLSNVSTNLSTLSEVNSKNIETNIPKYAEDISQEGANLDQEITGYIDNLQTEYENYIQQNINKYLGEGTVEAAPPGNSAESVSSVSLSTNNNIADNAISSLTSGITGGGDFGDIAMGVAENVLTTALNTVAPGIGSVVSTGINMLRSIFG